jgi:mRNA-degrading endonuclease toxin of MazEF toxin-antitoxin module
MVGLDRMSSQPLDRGSIVTVAAAGVYSGGNGLTKPSQLMVDKLFTVPMAALGAEIGRLESEHLQAMDQALRGWLGLG